VNTTCLKTIIGVSKNNQCIACSRMVDNKVQLRQHLIFYGARADLNYMQIREIESLISFVEHLLREESIHMRYDRVHEDYEY